MERASGNGRPFCLAAVRLPAGGSRRMDAPMSHASACILVACCALIAAPTPLAAAKPLPIHAAAIHWPGADGRLVHGYMALPAKARGRQPAVLVLTDGAVAGQTAAHALVDALASAGFLACTPRGDEPDADLGASLAWLRTNRYATGKLAIVALGPAATARAVAIDINADGVPAATALLVFDAAPTGTPPRPPTLSLPPPPLDDDLPPQATTFLKEHLR